VGLRFVLDAGVGDGGFLLWNEQVIPAIIDWRDPLVQHGLRHQIKYARLIRRRASSPQAKGADCDGNRYFVQLILEGHAFVKPKHEKGESSTVGLDIGPSTVAIVPRTGEAGLVTFCEELAPDTRKKRRLQRKMDRQRRANNPEHYERFGTCENRSPALAREQAVQGDQETTYQHRTQTGRPSQESAWAPGTSYCADGQDDQHGEYIVQSMAETVWQKRWTSRTRAVCSAFETPSCKNWRHPARSFHVPHQTVSILPSMQAVS
jgi:hypothetical protein